MDRIEAEILRGERAKQLLEEPLIVEAFQVIEKEYLDQWQNSPARDVEGREALFLMLKCLQRVKGHLTLAMESGMIEKATLAQRAGQTLSRVFSK